MMSYLSAYGFVFCCLWQILFTTSCETVDTLFPWTLVWSSCRLGILGFLQVIVVWIAKIFFCLIEALGFQATQNNTASDKNRVRYNQ
jgi:hypothetical protein